VRILVVDRFDVSRRALARLLARQGHAVATAMSLTEAVRLCESQAFDLLVCDGLDFPDGTGYDLMRDLARRCGVKGIAIDGLPDPGNLQASADAGFSHYLEKPVIYTELEEAINRVGRKS
jgi:CheY-like chemotaxis protein